MVPLYVCYLEDKVSLLTEKLKSTQADLDEMTWRFNNPERFNNL